MVYVTQAKERKLMNFVEQVQVEQYKVLLPEVWVDEIMISITIDEIIEKGIQNV